MKRKSKFSVLFLILILIFVLISALTVTLSLNVVKRDHNNTIMQIAAAVKEKYPDVSEQALAKILNGKADISDIQDKLSAYGLNETEWLSISESRSAYTVTAVSAAVCALSGLALFGIFTLYAAKQKRATETVTAYLSEINSGNYNLGIDENTEDEYSLLKNEIYKTTITLRRQKENEKKDKEILKNSLSDISHQLKTPLTSVIVMVDNLLENEDMPLELKREFLSDIKRCSANISFLVKALLTLSSFDANAITLKSKPESIERLFSECRQNTSVLAELKNVEVCCSPTNLTLNCDFHWLSEALSNIVKNCVEHTQSGGKVTLDCAENKLYTKITIRDNGCGISQKDLPHIFERFYKGKSSDENSVGIGLAMAKTIIENNGGYITVSSVENKGTTFTAKFFKA